MSSGFPTFKRPPITELVIGAQFAPMNKYSSAHAGWFWKSKLAPEWAGAHDAFLVPDQLETFGDEGSWRGPDFRAPEFQVSANEAPLVSRLLFFHKDQDRLLQLQPTRLLYNWRRKENDCPRYLRLRDEFLDVLTSLQDFSKEAEMGPLNLNQWEITYANFVRIGEDGLTASNWPLWFPGLAPRPSPLEALVEDGFSCERSFEIVPQQGRLHASLQLVRVRDKKETGLSLHLTARGPVADKGAAGIARGLELGHKIANQGFLALTSSEAHAAWGLTP